MILIYEMFFQGENISVSDFFLKKIINFIMQEIINLITVANKRMYSIKACKWFDFSSGNLFMNDIRAHLKVYSYANKNIYKYLESHLTNFNTITTFFAFVGNGMCKYWIDINKLMRRLRIGELNFSKYINGYCKHVFLW